MVDIIKSVPAPDIFCSNFVKFIEQELVGYAVFGDKGKVFFFWTFVVRIVLLAGYHW